MAVLRRVADSDHRPALVVTRPDRPRGRGRRLAAPPVADAARELGLELDQPESVNSDEARRPDRRRRARRGAGVRFRRAAQGAAAVRLRHAQRAPVAAAPLARCGPGGARHRGRRPGHRRQHHAADRRAGRRAGAPGGRGADRARGHLRHAGPAPVAARRGPAGAGAGHGGPAPAPARRGRSPTRRRSPPRTAGSTCPGPPWSWSAGCARCTPTSAPTWSWGTASACACCAPGRGTGWPARSTASDGRLFAGDLELLEVQPAGGRPMDAAAWLRGHGARLGSSAG